jgi:rhodanese-related sulfurtransferase
VVALSSQIRDRRPGLRVVDIRSSGEFDALHIPTAERIPLSDLSRTPFRRDETIVLYSEGGAHAGQGWVFLRALGYTQVYFLRGGLREWLDDVMAPTIAPTAGDSAKKAFAHVSEISRYFGGSPRVGPSSDSTSLSRSPLPPSRVPLPSHQLKRSNTWRRGC